ncbi:MAG: PH domain-containing protein [Candidatus Uhrbacteria bacterium]
MTIARIIQRKPYEDRIAVFRRHWTVFLWRFIGFVILAAIPFGAYLFLQSQFPEIFNHRVGYPMLVLAASAYELGIWLFAFTMFLDYELDMWVVTNDRFVNIEQQGLFARTISELDLWRVQDVTSEVKGILPTFFNYGDVYVQTAGAVERFVLEQVPHPHDIRKLILDMAEVDRKFHARSGVDAERAAAMA